MMTTPERLRRRQRTEGRFLILIGLAMVAQAWYFHSVDRGQSECVERNFSELSHSLDARSALTARETEQNKALWLIYANAAGLLKDDPTAELPPKKQTQLQRRLVGQLLEYRREITAIERERSEHPLPPYPAGECTQ